MAKTSATVTETETAPAPVGFTKTDAARLASDTRSILLAFTAANAEKGDRKARAQTTVRTLAAMVLSDVERDADLAKTARGTRAPVTVKSKLRGEETVATVSLPILDILRAVTFGGVVQGGGRIA